jgi:hypothetical protein
MREIFGDIALVAIIALALVIFGYWISEKLDS